MIYNKSASDIGRSDHTDCAAWINIGKQGQNDDSLLKTLWHQA